MTWCRAVSHQAWTNVDLSSARSSDNRLGAISQKIPQPSVTKIGLKIPSLKISFKSPRDQWAKQKGTVLSASAKMQQNWNLQLIEAERRIYASVT